MGMLGKAAERVEEDLTPHVRPEDMPYSSWLHGGQQDGGDAAGVCVMDQALSPVPSGRRQYSSGSQLRSAADRTHTTSV